MKSGCLRRAPQGLKYIPNFLTADEEGVLADELAGFSWEERGVIRKRGQIVRRREIDFLHNFARLTHQVTPGPPLPGILESLRHKIAKAIGLQSGVFQQAIATLYRPGAGIDWHIDTPDAFGETICGVSVAARCAMHFRSIKHDKTWSLCILPRSLYVLEGEIRWRYQHRILPLKQTRYSITFRTLPNVDKRQLGKTRVSVDVD
jgi:alkylated DNA repair dioxygenase AlkB